MPIPQLQGSEKQIAWAAAIRKEAMDWSELNIEKLRKQGVPEGYLTEIRAAFYAVINEPKRTTAKYWIDNRQVYDQDPAFYEAEITSAMEPLLKDMKKRLQQEFKERKGQ